MPIGSEPLLPAVHGCNSGGGVSPGCADEDDKLDAALFACCQAANGLIDELLLRDLNELIFTVLLHRKKRKREEDVVSLQTLDQSTDDFPRKKRPLSRMPSLASILSPVAGKIVKSFERALGSRASLPGDQKPMSPLTLTPRMNRAALRKDCAPPACRLWCDTVDVTTRGSLTDVDCKRQEAIHELILGEEGLVADLGLVDKIYRQPMEKLNLLSQEESEQIFGIVRKLIPCHQDLVSQLVALKQPNNVIARLGRELIDWVPRLKDYEKYCANQVYAKALLDCKRNDLKVADFLQRCQGSSFSRKLDLWTFLDLPRNRLVKYPLLLGQILKYTSEETEESLLIRQSICQIEEIIKDVDLRMGESHCQQVVASLDFPDTVSNNSLVKSARLLLCSGELKNERGTKLEVFLFDTVVALTYARKNSARDGPTRYVCRHLLPVAQLRLEESCLSTVELNSNSAKDGSFSKKRALKRFNTDRHTFAFSCGNSTTCTTVTLVARDEHDCKQWIASMKKAMSEISRLEHTLAAPTLSPASTAISQSDSTNGAAALSADCKVSLSRESQL